MCESLTTMETNNEITNRARIDYDITEQMVMKNSKNIVLLEIDNKKLKGESIIYDNQEECSLAIVSILHNKKMIHINWTYSNQQNQRHLFLHYICIILHYIM